MQTMANDKAPVKKSGNKQVICDGYMVDFH